MKLRIQVLQSSILEKQIVISKLHLWHEMMQRRILGVAGSKRSDFVNYSLSAYPGRCLQVQGDGKIPFILLKPIGRGGFSVVWEVIDTIHCERLAAKFTNYPTDKQESFQDGVQAATDWLNKCFTREVMILTNEKHPNVRNYAQLCVHTHFMIVFQLLRLYYHFRWRINYASLFGTALVYELCAYDLGSWLSRVPLASRRLSQMFGWLKELLQGLKRLHTERHVVHMDIKPQNILVSRDECLKISDFGLHLVLEECGTQQYQAQVPMHMSCNWNGSILYQPPEHLAAIVSLKEDYSLDARYDIWSTGCVAFEMFSETSLFRHFTLSSTEQRLDLYRQVHDYLNALDIDSFVDQHVAHLGARKLIKELLRLRPVGDAAILLVEKCSLMPPSTDEDT
ncbi:protein kinase domain protein [Gregarina niphandrodes]|uniref:Protein kinase domain protein n=1 Tax=Gregarina niphandrodes TaxID=110365 RepID=A0A023B468_GRENI|nr:protein kinase domain protein [Gregarina niphandrodes]EZG56498.1 protein kinase domain protein [Gregarina niphandrodes]|eukprot:XP_011131237.1 protein kinase domain protein [Gregarina niphandrodes]